MVALVGVFLNVLSRFESRITAKAELINAIPDEVKAAITVDQPAREKQKMGMATAVVMLMTLYLMLACCNALQIEKAPMLKTRPSAKYDSTL